EHHGIPFLAMPLLTGESLEERLTRARRLPLLEVLRIGREMAEGLAVAHEAKLIHRDIKPANIWLEGARARVKILDFGLARPVEGNAQVTQSGTVVGTPAYMAPEQAEGRRVDARVDLFSLGCVLYRMLTGQLPFPGTSMVAVLVAVVHEQPRSVQELAPQAPPELANLIMRLLAKKPEDRPTKACAVAAVLATLERWRQVSAEPVLPTVTVSARLPPSPVPRLAPHPAIAAPRAVTIPSLPPGDTVPSRSPGDLVSLCPSCGRKLKLAAALWGHKARCPQCQAVLRVPEDVLTPDTVVDVPQLGETNSTPCPASEMINSICMTI